MSFPAVLALSLGLILGAQSAPNPHSGSIPVTDVYPDDPVLAKLIEPLKAEIKATYGIVIAQCPAGLYRGGNGSENLLGYWLADVMRLKAEALLGVPVKFGYTNSGGIRANIRPGVVKVGDIVEVMPFENELVVAELTGAQVIELVKEGLQHRSVEPVSGVKVATGGSAEHPLLLVTWSDGSAIDPHEVVKLATSDYLLASSAALKHSRNPVLTGITMRQTLLDACTALGLQGKPLVAPGSGRMQVTPELIQALKSGKQGS